MHYFIQENFNASIRTTIDTCSYIVPGLQEAAAALFVNNLKSSSKIEVARGHYQQIIFKTRKAP